MWFNRFSTVELRCLTFDIHAVHCGRAISLLHLQAGTL